MSEALTLKEINSFKVALNYQTIADVSTLSCTWLFGCYCFKSFKYQLSALF